MEEEAAQEAAIKAYEDQLAQVELTKALLDSAEERAPLEQLILDLQELIDISKEGLLKLKKDNLMKLLQGDVPNEAPSSSSSEFVAISNGIPNDSPSTSTSLSKEPPEPEPSPPDPDETYADYAHLLGTMRLAPYPFKGGLHNVVVHSLEGVDEEGRVEVKVIYTHPVEPKMVTCPYFLNGKCRFDSTCRKSHGEVVLATDLRDYVEPDFANVDVGSSCLAKREDRNGLIIWCPARVLHLEEGLVTVQTTNVNDTVALPFSDILPLKDEDSSSSSSDDDDAEDDDDDETSDRPGRESISKAVEDEDMVREISVVEDMTQFGVWEQSTRGIGTKLLVKWGYVKGLGLGKDGEGRVLPVEAKIYPQGKSLDVCMAMRLKRETGAVDPLIVKKRKRRKEKKKAEATKKGYQKRTKEEEAMSAFDLINSIKLTKKGGTMVIEEDKNAKKQLKTSEKSGRDLRVQLLQTEGEIAKVEREMERAAETIDRNEKKNPIVALQAKEKMKELEIYRDKLKRSLKFIQGEQKNRSGQKKLSVF